MSKWFKIFGFVSYLLAMCVLTAAVMAALLSHMPVVAGLLGLLDIVMMTTFIWGIEKWFLG